MRTELICGQYLDLLGQAAGDGTVDSALRVVRFKSAKYTVERPLQLGAALAAPRAAGDPATERACRGYGIPVGVAFQLRDDVLGVFGDPAQTGKPASDDLREGKRTVLVAIAGSGPAPPTASCSTGCSATGCSTRPGRSRSARSSPKPAPWPSAS